MRLPDLLLGREMIDGILGQAVEQGIQAQGRIAIGDLRRQRVQQFDQLAMLCVDDRQAGVEVVVPRKDINRIHAACAKTAPCGCHRGRL